VEGIFGIAPIALDRQHLRRRALGCFPIDKFRLPTFLALFHVGYLVGFMRAQNGSLFECILIDDILSLILYA
jgi:hypothetical protein